MFDIGWMEMLVIAVVAIVVIGPKDLPRVMHTVGQWMARARAVARTFQDQMEELAREAGADDLRKGINSIGSFDPDKQLRQAVDPTGEMEAQMKAMTDVGSLTPESPKPAAPAPEASTEQKIEQVAVGNAQAEAAPSDPVPSDPASSDPADKTPEPPLAPGETSYKGPQP